MKAFWESLLLNKDAEDCVYHVIVPTLMYTVMPKCLPIDDGDVDAEDVLCAQQANHQCVYCEQSMDGACVVVGVRAVVAKRETRHGFIYRFGFGAVSICESCCATEQLITSGINTNGTMIETMFEQLEQLGRAIHVQNVFNNLTGSELLQLVLDAYDANHVAFVTAIGRHDKECATCKRCADDLLMCRGCRLLRYCNAQCQRTDWARHRAQCQYVRTHSIFVRGKIKDSF